VLPAQQRLEPDDLEGIEVDDRLVGKGELFFGDRFSHLGDPLEAVQGRLVELVFFAGLTQEEATEALGVSLRTVQSDWRKARAWLLAELGRRDPG